MRLLLSYQAKIFFVKLNFKCIKKINNSLTKNFIQGLRPLSNTLPTQIKKVLKKNGFNLSSIVDNWTKIVGNNISNKCYPINIKAQGNFKDVTLILNVIHGKEIDIEYSKKKRS